MKEGRKKERKVFGIYTKFFFFSKLKNLWEGDVQRLTLFIMQALRPSHKEVEEEGNQTALEVCYLFISILYLVKDISGHC